MRRFVGVLLVCVLLAGCGGGSSELIAFWSDRDGDWEIFVMDADGSQVRQLTDNDDWDSDSAW